MNALNRELNIGSVVMWEDRRVKIVSGYGMSARASSADLIVELLDAEDSDLFVDGGIFYIDAMDIQEEQV